MKQKENDDLYPTIPSLVGKKTYLRPLVADDMGEIHRWFLASDPQTQTCHPVALISPEERIERARKESSTVEDVHFAVVTKDDNRLVGHIGYFHLNMLNRSAELGYLIAPSERKNGFAGEGLRLLIGYLFNELNLNRVYAQTGSFNKESIKLLESLDFHLDGTLRQHHFYRGDYYDDLLYSLLRFEYSP
jgi:ribosomal-protein-alanine N-acetyltransferase